MSTMDHRRGFPSIAQRQRLNDRMLCKEYSAISISDGDLIGNTATAEIPESERGYSSLTEEERWHYHAYDYAWRRIFLENPNPTSPIDTTGKWYNPRLVDDAEQMLASHFRRKPQAKITPADEAAARRDYAAAGRFRAQDQARNAARNKIVGDGMLPDGSWSAEAKDFVTLCKKQIVANIRRFSDQNKQTTAEALKDLGVRASLENK